MGSQLIGSPFTLFMTDENNLSVYGCMTTISSPNTGFRVNVDFCTFGSIVSGLDHAFRENELMEGDTIGFTSFKAFYR